MIFFILEKLNFIPLTINTNRNYPTGNTVFFAK